MKIKNSTAAASDELRQPLNISDIQNLAVDLQNQLKGKEEITSNELFEILVNTMRLRGFFELADAYVNNSSNFWG